MALLSLRIVESLGDVCIAVWIVDCGISGKLINCLDCQYPGWVLLLAIQNRLIVVYYLLV